MLNKNYIADNNITGKKMNKEYIYECVTELIDNRQNPQSNSNTVLETALFIEDTFGLVLNDEEICEENLGTHKNIVLFVCKKLGIE